MASPTMHAPKLEFAGQVFLALPERALFWPQHRALIVADLHLEKASWYAARGQPLPPYDSIDTLDRLAVLARHHRAESLWCLGDSFHDADAAARIEPATAARLRRLASETRLVWVAGNHDGLLDQAWGGMVADELVVDNIILRHQSDSRDTRSEISGHFHPKLRIASRGHPLSRPCFVTDGRRLILPAFGSLTGGLDVADIAIARCFDGDYQARVATPDRLLSFACAAAATDCSVSQLR